MNLRALPKEIIFSALLFLLFLAGVMMRPLLPVDETRYLTVAWEMFLTKNWFLLTYNFEPYSHKPPLLFWLINIFWSVFGVSRVAAAMPVLLSSLAVVFLTGKMAKELFPRDKDIASRSRLLLMGSIPFLLYGSLMMFDIMICAFTLAALLCLFSHARTRSIVTLLGYGLFMGLGVLTKGPVVYIYALLPALLAPLWVPPDHKRRWLIWYAGSLMALLFSFLPVLLWLVPLLKGANADFVHWLLWKQTADRVAGGFSNIHPRPFYFYLMVLPAFFLPWGLFPAFWRAVKKRRREFKTSPGLRFISCWLLAAFLAFSFLITGKQPHYLAPLIPGLFIGMAHFMDKISFPAVQKTVLASFAFFLIAHIVAVKMFFPAYDMRPVAACVAAHQDRPWAFVRNYNGEIGFLGRMEHPLTSTNLRALPLWFKKHPDGYAVIRYRSPKEVKKYKAVFVKPFRVNHYLGVFKSKGKISETPDPRVKESKESQDESD